MPNSDARMIRAETSAVIPPHSTPTVTIRPVSASTAFARSRGAAPGASKSHTSTGHNSRLIVSLSACIIVLPPGSTRKKCDGTIDGHNEPDAVAVYPRADLRSWWISNTMAPQSAHCSDARSVDAP
jgi:hypothetical protein